MMNNSFDIVSMLKLGLNGGAGFIVYWFMELPFLATFLERLSVWTDKNLHLSLRFLKRATTFLVSVVLGLLLCGCLVLLGLFEWPALVEGWINLIGSLGLVYLASQAAHLKDL